MKTLHFLLLCSVLAVPFLGSSNAHAFTIINRFGQCLQPEFGDTDGIAKGETNPASPENHVIADLDKAPRNVFGMVEYAADFFILRPAEPATTNSVLVYDVTNRGRKMIFNLLDDASMTNTFAASLVGDSG